MITRRKRKIDGRQPRPTAPTAPSPQSDSYGSDRGAFAQLFTRYHPPVLGGQQALTPQQCEDLIAAGVFQKYLSA